MRLRFCFGYFCRSGKASGQVAPDLAWLREPARLERLAEDERKGCLALWAEVEAVLARCGNTR